MKVFTRMLWLGCIVVSVASGMACSSATTPPTPAAAPSDVTPSDNRQIRYYTCPMHPQIHEDHPGACPICHMDLVPVYETPAAEGNTSAAPSTGVHIASQQQQLIGVTTAHAVRKPVHREIRTVGHVAFDPELAIAQHEFLAIRRSVPALTTAARSRLQILGMSEEEIRALARTRKSSSNLYLPDAQGSVWVYATLFSSEMDAILPGLQAVISLPSGTAAPLTGIVRGVGTVINPTTRSVNARIEVPHAGGVLRPNTFVNVTIHVQAGDALTIPKSAVLYTGTRTMVYIQSADEMFEPRAITTGIESGDDIVVLEGLRADETVVTQAAFLIDSESQLRPAVSGNVLPTCPSGEAWDVGMRMCMPKVGASL